MSNDDLADDMLFPGAGMSEEDNAKVRVLSVEDDEMNQLFIKEVLSEKYDIRTAMDGEEALEIVNQYKPDIILLDVMLPGISGYDVCRAIRNTPNHARVKIIFTSAKTRPKEREEGYAAGGNDYITKPFSYDELLGKVNIFSQMQTIEDEKLAYQLENVDLRARIKLLEFLNHARRHYGGRTELSDFAKALLKEFVQTVAVEAGVFLTCHRELGVQHGIIFLNNGEGGELDPRGIEQASGVYADIFENYKPVCFNHLSLSPESMGLPSSSGEVNAVLGVSFLISEQLKGALCLVNKENSQAFSAGEVKLVGALIVELEHVFRDQEWL